LASLLQTVLRFITETMSDGLEEFSRINLKEQYFTVKLLITRYKKNFKFQKPNTQQKCSNQLTLLGYLGPQHHFREQMKHRNLWEKAMGKLKIELNVGLLEVSINYYEKPSKCRTGRR